RAFARHGIERVSQSDNPHRHRNIFHQQTIGIPGPIAALMVPANDFRNPRPGKLHPAYDLMADNGVVGHFTKFAGIKRAWLTENVLVDGNFSDAVQISGGEHVSELD